jgi:hypothetical protein
LSKEKMIGRVPAARAHRDRFDRPGNAVSANSTLYECMNATETSSIGYSYLYYFNA